MTYNNWPNIINCPHCQINHKFEAQEAGKKIKCKGCGKPFFLLPSSDCDDTLISSGKNGQESFSKVGKLCLDLRPGQIVDENYLVIKALGEGGLSRVFQVRDLRNKNILALKIPRPCSLERLPSRYFFQEATACLKPAPHPNLVSCHNVEIIMGLPAIIMEYVAGGDLASLMNKGEGPLYRGEMSVIISRLLDILIQALRGIGYAHSLNLNRLDIKPRNILVGRGGRVLISDYGPLMSMAKAAYLKKETDLKPLSAPLTKVTESDESKYVKQLLGTYQYFSPETADGNYNSGPAADLWAAALTILECFVGRRLWEMGSTAGQALEYYLARRKPTPRVPINNNLADFLRKALSTDIAKRHQSAQEMENELMLVFENTTGRSYSRPVARAQSENLERLQMKKQALLKIRREIQKNGR